MVSLIAELGTLLNTPPDSVEILPGDGAAWLSTGDAGSTGSPFVLVDGNLGVPHKTLLRTYMEAVPLFHHALRSLSSSQSAEAESEEITTLLHTSSILILSNGGHQTAWNARKALVLSHPDPDPDPHHLNAQLELRFCAALLGVKECAKQAGLWFHRRWMLRYLFPFTAGSLFVKPGGADEEEDEDSLVNTELSPEALKTEFELCTRACTTYERNYFAWTHRRRCLSALHHQYRYLLSIPTPTTSSSRFEYAKLLRDEREWCTRWIEQNVSDHSAVSYRCALERVYVALFIHEGKEESIWTHARSLTESYPEHESLWLYLREAHALRLSLPAEERGGGGVGGEEELAAFARTFVEESQTEADARARERQTLIKRNASQFLAWLDRFHGESASESGSPHR